MPRKQDKAQAVRLQFDLVVVFSSIIITPTNEKWRDTPCSSLGAGADTIARWRLGYGLNGNLACKVT
jgi:hypothetical protein